MVQHIHHRGKHLHAVRLPLALLHAEAVPRWNVRRPRTELEFFRDEPALQLLRITRLAQLVPATVIHAIVLLYVRLRRMQRIMRRIERHIEQERILLLRRFVEKIQREVAIGMGGVKRPAIQRLWHLILFPVETKCVVSLKETRRPGQVPPISLKTKVSRFLAQMPLADHCSEVVRLAKHLGDCRPTIELRPTRLVTVKAGQQ